MKKIKSFRCTYIDENFYWSGEFCNIKTAQPIDPDKIKMIIAICALGKHLFIHPFGIECLYKTNFKI